MSNLYEKLILSKNPKLKEEDLEMLGKLYKEFDVIGIYDKVFDYDIETILSWLIVNKLPYDYASQMVTRNFQLYYPIICVENGKVKPVLDNDMIAQLTVKMNQLLGYAS